jgi:hypothetical protein
MELTPIDLLAVGEYYKKDADQTYKKLKENAEDYLASKRMSDGTTSIESKLFGGEFHYGKTRAKNVVEFHMCDEEALAEWLEANQDAAIRYAILNGADFGMYWFNLTGELPEGVSRVECEESARETPPKLYKFDVGNVRKALGIEQSFGEQLLGKPENLLEDHLAGGRDD